MHHPVTVVVAVRYLVNLGLLTVFLYPRMGAGLWRVHCRGLVFVRGLCLALASLTIGLALRLMPAGETVAIVYLSPFAVMLLSGPLMGERVRALFWLWAGLGFAGSVVDLAARCRAGPFGCGVCGDECGAGYLVSSVDTEIVGQ